MDIFGRLATNIRLKFKNFVFGIKKYFKKLLLPIYLFPIKLITYSAYYLLKFLIKLLIAFIGLIIDCIVFPFKSLKNFLKSIVLTIVVIYLCLTLVVIADYLKRQYGSFRKTFCALGYPINQKLQKSVVRIIGGYSEGSGFFVEDDKVLTNFHVIADEPSPKIVFPDGSFTTPVKILGNKDADLALLFVKEKRSDLVFKLPDEIKLYEDEPLVSGGYALGTNLSGETTVVKGNFVNFRKQKTSPVGYIQTNLSLVRGMSGGPLVDQCGQVVGINTQSLAGLSLFITGVDAKNLIPSFTDQNITKINVDPSKSPEDAVYAFYTYLKARRMRDGFNLLSAEYLKKTNYQEWTNRFTDILDVNVFKTERYQNSGDVAFVKFSTKNWVDGEAEMHFYEGTWQTVNEDGVYKMFRADIKEVENPDWNWFYE